MPARNIDALYIATGDRWHARLAIAAMRAGKPIGLEAGGAYSLDDCWQLVHTYEQTHTELMFLENCCYGETEMLAYNLVRKGLLGEITHGEGAYIHDLRTYNYAAWDDAKERRACPG